MLIRNLISDLGQNFIISLAPISYALINDVPGMAGWKIKDLLNSEEGKSYCIFKWTILWSI